MKRDYPATDVQPGTRWYVFGKHQEVIERRQVAVNETGAPSTIPVVTLCPLDPDGNRVNGKKKPPDVAAWRVVYYGEPSQAFGNGNNGRA